MRTEAEVERAVAGLAREQRAGLIVAAYPYTVGMRAVILKSAEQHRVPLICSAAIGAGHSVKKLDEIAPPSLPLRGLGHLSAQTSTLEGVEDGFWHSSVSEWSMSASVKSRHSHRKMSRPL